MPNHTSRRASVQGLSIGYQQLLQQVERELKIRHYAQKTRKNYLGHIRRSFFWLKGASLPQEPESVKCYLLFLVDHKEVSGASLHNCHSALRFLYKEILHRDSVIDPIKRPRHERRLPDVFSLEEVKELLAKTDNLKHRMILSLIYAGGLRVGEVVRLKPGDIDSQRMLIRVRQGKGKKDRYTLFSQAILEELRTYWLQCSPQNWLFPGARPGRHLSERSVQKFFQRAVKTASIHKPVTTHCLRHYAEFRIMPSRDYLKM